MIQHSAAASNSGRRRRRRRRWIALCGLLTLWSGPESIPAAETADELQEITVTARKRDESLMDVPESITLFSARTLADYDIRSFTDYAAKVPNLSFSYGSAASGNAGIGFSTSRGTAIRGVAGINTTAFYIDDTPVFDSMDPRIVDIDRIEVLKGPQGTLYGSGSEGGAVRIITRQPSLTDDDYRYSLLGAHTEHGGFDEGGEAAGNLVLVPGIAAARLMGFFSHDSGFLTRTFPSPTNPAVTDSVTGDGGVKVDGASIAALLRPVARLDITLRLLYQHQYTDGWPAAFAPPPSYAVTSFSLNRAADVEEASSDRWTLPSMSLRYAGPGWSLTSSTSYLDRIAFDREDGTSGTDYQYLTLAGFVPPVGTPSIWDLNTSESRFTEETRLSVEELHRISGVAGVYYTSEHFIATIPPTYTPGLAAAGLWPNNVAYTAESVNPSRETAVFGELYAHLLERLTLTLGARAYWLHEQAATSANGFFQGGLSIQPLTTTNEHGISPKYALDYHVDPNTLVYVSAAKGFRPGGVNLPLAASCDPELASLGINPASAGVYKSDTVWSYETGLKWSGFEQRLAVTTALFQIDWQGIQQGVYLPICGFSILGNSGAARNRGAELELAGRPIAGLDLRASAGYMDAKITEAGASSPQLPGSRVFNVPRLTTSAGAVYEHPIDATVSGFLSADWSYVGASLSGNNTPSTPRLRPSYTVTNLRLGARFGATELSVFLKNLFDTKANLGDITPVSYEARIIEPDGANVADPRVVTLEPRQIGLQYRYGFR
jgi:outer membrane receptor protein involved in Fe transport